MISPIRSEDAGGERRQNDRLAAGGGFYVVILLLYIDLIKNSGLTGRIS